MAANSDTQAVQEIAKDVAMQLCARIREENRHKPLSLSALQCGGCMAFSKGDPNKMCLSNERNRGCNLVNARYDVQHRAGVAK